jgi:diguanylate cyclase (GGDEF)-like protein
MLAIVLTAYALRKFDLTRRQAEAEVVGLNKGLEKLLEERIDQVAQLSAALSANKSLKQDSLHDGLTNIPNRRFLDTYLTRQIAVARRHQRSLAFVLCDVDSFKSYNDHYGHQAGDECLKQIATAIRACCNRPADMASRYGGEEFALVLPDTDLAGATRIAEAARQAVAELRISHVQSTTGPYVSISGGIAILLWEINMTAEELIAAADRSLYRAKDEGRNRMISVHAEAA